MELRNLQKHIRTLATLEETNSPVTSYYLNRESDELGNRLRLTEQGRVLRQSLWGRAKHDFEEAMNQIEAYIKEHSDADFSHSICPECAKKMYPNLNIYDE